MGVGGRGDRSRQELVPYCLNKINTKCVLMVSILTLLNSNTTIYGHEDIHVHWVYSSQCTCVLYYVLF